MRALRGHVAAMLLNALRCLLIVLPLGALTSPAWGQAAGQSLFTTQTPALPSVSDGVAYELGMKFQLNRTGQITAIRYWKSSGETGTHVGRIWSANGTLLASATFSGETSSGWQQQALSAPLSVQTNTT